MRLKLLLKQSFRDFWSKITLYLTFTLFLILTISVSLGMVSFSYGYLNSFQQTLGSNRVNARINQVSFLPAWSEDSDAKINVYLAKEQKNPDDPTSQGFLYDFAQKLLVEDNNPPITTQELQVLLLGVGYNRGSVEYDLKQTDLLQDSVLSRYLTVDSNDLNKMQLNRYNELAYFLRHALNQKYQTKNLITGYVIQYLWDHPNDYNLGSHRSWNGNLEMFLNGQTLEPGTGNELYWEYLKTDPSMGIVDENSPRTLKINPTNTQKIWKSVNWDKPEYAKYLTPDSPDQYRFVYVTPTFLHRFKLQIGQTIGLRFKNWDNYNHHPTDPDSYLIAGSISSPDLISTGKNLTIVIPYPLMVKEWDSWNSANGQDQFQQETNHETTFSWATYFNVKKQNGNLTGGQNVAGQILNNFLVNRQNPGKPLQTTDTEWAKYYPAYAYNLTQTLFLIIAYIIGFFALGLLFIVFYFITQQIVFMQRQTLFFLKAMGVKNSGLSWLTTFAMLPPLLIGLILGLFGSLFIQEMMYSLTFNGLCFYMSYWSFNFVFFLALFGIIIFAFLIFYLINILLIRSKNLTLEGMNAGKMNAHFFEVIKAKMYKAPAKLRIGLSFTFKNIYKNLISYFILSITFGVILFGTQFNTSLGVSAYAYEKWNAPYKSVYYANNLTVFAPTTETVEPQNDIYVRSYDQVADLNGLQPIRSRTELYLVINAYRESLNSPETSSFNWRNYYLRQDYVRDELNSIADNQENYDQFIEELTNQIKENFPDVDDQAIFSVIKMVDAIISRYRDVRDSYNYRAGFNILFGRVLLPSNQRAVLSLQSSTDKINFLASAPNDHSTQTHFGLGDFPLSQDFLVPGDYQELDIRSGEIITKHGNLLRVNVSSYLASIWNLHRGNSLDLEVVGLKTGQNPQSLVVHAYINGIVKEDTVRRTVYTSQAGLIEYALDYTNQQLDDFVDLYQNEDNIKYAQGLIVQQKAYENLLNQLNDPINLSTLSNTVFDQTTDTQIPIPWGIRYLTVPIFHYTNPQPDDPNTSQAGSRIEDFYDQVELPNYLNAFGKDIMVFDLVTKQLLIKAAPFQLMMKRLVIILVIISFVISSILITLVLLENRNVILLFKAMGYKKSEINWYLISGYFVSAILATITAIVLALVVLNLSRGVIAQYLTTAIYFVWSWEFIVFAFGLAAAFCLAISISIIVYTNLQKPRDAFATL